jgi:hypothetical protein
MNDVQRLEQEARQILSDRFGDLAAVVLDSMNYTDSVDAAAEPVRGLLAGLEAEIAQINEFNARITNTISSLSPYSAVPQVGPLLAALTATQAVVNAMAAANAAKTAMALLIVPSPSALVAAGLSAGLGALKGQLRQSINELALWIEGDA